MVTGVSCMFIVCNTPMLVAVYMKNLYPGFNLGLKFHEEYVMTMNVIFLITSVNASANFFIYFNLNRKFRADLKNICGCKIETD